MSNLSVPLVVDVPSDVTVGVYPVTFGVPFRRGDLRAEMGFQFSMEVVNGDTATLQAVQARPSAWWSANSDDGVRWLLVDGQIDVAIHSAETRYTLRHGITTEPEHALDVTVQGSIRVETHPGHGFVLPRKGEAGISHVSADGVLIDGDSGIECLLTNDAGDERAAVIDRCCIEEQGPLRTVVRHEATFPHARSIARLDLRIEMFAGLPLVRLLHTFVFKGDETRPEDRIRGLSIRVPVRGQGFRARFGADLAQPTGITELAGDGASYAMRQDQQNRALEYSRLEAFTPNDDELVVEAERHAGWADLSWIRGGVSAGLRDAWQSYPNEFEIGDGALRINLWPRRGRPMDLSKSAILAEYASSSWPDSWDDEKEKILNGTGTATGVARTHEIWLRLDGAPADSETLLSFAAQARNPVFAVATGEWNCATDALGPVHPEDPEHFPEIERALDAMFDRYLAWNECLRGWGFWDWFDVHDQVSVRRTHALHKELPMTRPYRFWGSTHYGFPNAPWVLFYRSGRRKYLHVAEANARHCMDVDRIHHGPHKGAQHYVNRSLVHWADEPTGCDYSQLEYLAMAWYLRGERRAVDVFESWGEAVHAGFEAGGGLFHPVDKLGLEVRFENLRHAGPPLGNLTELYRIKVQPADWQAPESLLPCPASTLTADWCEGAAERYFDLVVEGLREVRFKGEGRNLPEEEVRRIEHQCFGSKLRWCGDGLVNWLRLRPDDETVRDAVAQVARILATDPLGLSFQCGAALAFWPPADATDPQAIVQADMATAIRIASSINVRGPHESPAVLGWPDCEVEPTEKIAAWSWISERGSSGDAASLHYPYQLRSIPAILAAWQHTAAPQMVTETAVGSCEVAVSPVARQNASLQFAGPRIPEIRIVPESTASRLVLRLGRLQILQVYRGTELLEEHHREHFACTGITGEREREFGLEEYPRSIASEKWCVREVDPLLTGNVDTGWQHGDVVDPESSTRTDGLVVLTGLEPVLHTLRFAIAPTREPKWSKADETAHPEIDPGHYEGEYIERGNVELLHADGLRLTIDALDGPPDVAGRHCIFGRRTWFFVPSGAKSLHVAVRLPETFSKLEWTPVVDLARHGAADAAVGTVVRRFRGHEPELGSHQATTTDFATHEVELEVESSGWWSVGPLPRPAAPWPNNHQFSKIRRVDLPFPVWFRVELELESGAKIYPRVTTDPSIWLDES